ncbi:RNA 2',3'-cyclic phosphodiesterase [Streptomyces beigongshangae]|uniref:RNA 2',3'-cyclic phosphodiesterase n=1 Tax=Streptomyces beigongshangae TaxID=2841597 RepID=UPI001C85C972|nr:RNA 2',3'-cyclic phosphodiesterase [Streptomyces sp. REN17]
MRLFAAVLPPADAVTELGPVVGELRGLPGAGRGLRWTDPSGWHFTLAFYGEVAEDVVPDLSARLGRAALRTAPFPLSLRGGGRFGDRALWVGAAGDVRTLRLLAERALAAGRRAGVAREERRGHRPHLTLARASGDVELAPYAASLDGFAGRDWTVADLCLVRSRLPVSGVPGDRPRYEVLRRWPLGGPLRGDG